MLLFAIAAGMGMTNGMGHPENTITATTCLGIMVRMLIMEVCVSVIKSKRTHWGFRDTKGTHCLCGKEARPLSVFSEYGYVSTNESLVTCKLCIEEIKRTDKKEGG